MKKKIILVLISAVIVFLFIAQTSLFSNSKKESKKKSKTDRLFEMSLEELMNVKISTAGKRPQRIGDIPASVVLITREDIETFGYSTLTEILNDIPGLYSINDYAEGGANFGVRGFWSGQVNDNMLILVNGVHQVSDFLSNYPLSKISIPVEAIDRIEVIRGPMSVFYGNGAFFGVINIITNEPEKKTPNKVFVSVGSENTKKLFVRLAEQEGNLRYVFNSSVYDTDGIDELLSKMVEDMSVLLPLGVPPDSRTGGRLENNEKYFNFSGSYKDFSFNMSYNEGKKEFYFNLPSVADGSLNRSSTLFLSVGYRKKLSDKVTAEGKFCYSQNRDTYKYDHFFENFYGTQQLLTNGVEMELNIFTAPNPKFDITAGLYYRAVLNASNNYDLPFLGTSLENVFISLAEDDRVVTQAIFTQANYNLFKNLKIVAGVRLEQSPKYEVERSQTPVNGTPVESSGIYDRSNIEIIPRFAALYYLNKHNIFKFLFGKAINRSSFAQNSQNSLTPDRPDLEPESIQTLELNYIATLSSKFTLNASFFRNTLNNLITRVVIYDVNSGEYDSYSANAGKMVTNGVEMSINLEPFYNFRLELSGTYQETKDKRPDFEDIDVAYSPKFLGYLKASYRANWFTLAVTGNYVSSMQTYWSQTETNPVGNRIGTETDGYFLLGANLRIRDIFIDGLDMNVRCSNLLDEEIRYPTFTNNEWANRGTIGMKRSFLVSLGYKF